MTLVPLARGAIAVHTDVQLAGAVAGEGTLVRDDKLADHLETIEGNIGRIGGRWPDRVYMKIDDLGCRNGGCDSVERRDDGEWVAYDVPAPRRLVGLHTDFLGGPDGRVFGVRTARALSVNELSAIHEVAHDFTPADERRSARVSAYKPPRPPPPRLDLLEGKGAAPPLPGKQDIGALTMSATGELFLVQAGAAYRAPPRATRWQPLVKPGAADAPTAVRAVAVGPDARVHVLTDCAGSRSAIHRWDGAHWTRLPPVADDCVYNIAVADDGVLYATDDRLWRTRADDTWEPVPVRVKTRDGGVAPLGAVDVLTRPGALWVSGCLEDDHSRCAVVTTLPVAAVVDLGEVPGKTIL